MNTKTEDYSLSDALFSTLKIKMIMSPCKHFLNIMKIDSKLSKMLNFWLFARHDDECMMMLILKRKFFIIQNREPQLIVLIPTLGEFSLER